jgi:hypothetical protein
MSDRKNEHGDKISDCYDRLSVNPDFIADVLCIINNKHPLYMLDCYLNNTSPEEGFLFEDTMLEVVAEHIKEYG